PYPNPYNLGPYTNPLASLYYPGPNSPPIVGPYPYPNPYLNPFPSPYPNPYPNLYPQPGYPGWPSYPYPSMLTMYPSYPPRFSPQQVNPWLAQYGTPFPGFGGLGGSSFGGSNGFGTFGSGLPVGYSPTGSLGN